MACDELGGAKVDVLDDAVVVEEDVWAVSAGRHGQREGKLTFGLDVSVGDPDVVEIGKTLEELERVHHYDLLDRKSTRLNSSHWE